MEQESTSEAERETTDVRSFCVLDDDKKYISDLSTLAERSQTISIRCFSEGSELIDLLTSILESGDQLPTCIIDHNLRKSPEDRFSNGVKVIREIFKLCRRFNSPAPEIIAHSRGDQGNLSLLMGGASSEIKKHDPARLIRALEKR